MTVTVEQLEKALTVLDQVVAAVNIGKGSFTASYGHRVSGGSQEHAPLPVDLNAIIKKETVQKFLLNRALMIATKEQPLTGLDIPALTSYLTSRSAMIVTQFWCDSFYQKAIEHAEDLEAHGRRPEPRVFAGRCGPCGRELFAVMGEKEAVCDVCKGSYKVAPWRDFAKGFFGQHIGTPADLSRKLSAPEYGIEVKPDTIRKWATARNGNPPKLERANPATNETGQPIPPAYRLNDVLDLYHSSRRTPLEGRTA